MNRYVRTLSSDKSTRIKTKKKHYICGSVYILWRRICIRCPFLSMCVSPLWNRLRSWNAGFHFLALTIQMSGAHLCFFSRFHCTRKLWFSTRIYGVRFCACADQRDTNRNIKWNYGFASRAHTYVQLSNSHSFICFRMVWCIVAMSCSACNSSSALLCIIFSSFFFLYSYESRNAREILFLTYAYYLQVFFYPAHTHRIIERRKKIQFIHFIIAVDFYCN